MLLIPMVLRGNEYGRPFASHEPVVTIFINLILPPFAPSKTVSMKKAISLWKMAFQLFLMPDEFNSIRVNCCALRKFGKIYPD